MHDLQTCSMMYTMGMHTLLRLLTPYTIPPLQAQQNAQEHPGLLPHTVAADMTPNNVDFAFTATQGTLHRWSGYQCWQLSVVSRQDLL